MTIDDDRTAGISKVTELLKDSKLCMFTTHGRDGHLLSRPMALQEHDFDGSLWFFARNDSRKVGDVRADSSVNVSFQSGTAWVSVSGRAEIVLDEAKKKELWNQAAAAWFDDGPESPEVVLISVEAEGAEYWSAPGSKVSTLLAYAKSRITGDKPDVGMNDTVEM
ncbi:pyridoxamine 5'-phosphate oxidase [Rhodococcus sp. 06-156-3C]|uniref:pyridoxamine 5'-phosphate oxidase family protein n=1 Tax=Nocardiaceae TaxID=85025 RepID=UPI000364CD3F|nr:MULTISPECIES: pyridoxamine 5'-phosphate oxidase family protein [Rhodococcus]OZD12531.1 pyridoxamine 5'-phosphate oxidase [Rhodococcus sp. 06-156-4a]OZD18060.1 pyridoxamine 5'-phosphate oxidase [Rhodococcus sp. 06-156-3C]OZD20378.1 pyridoxamine 5'-phosphate oxidase [Rhodococcus sp. 06-156-4C]OZD29224.1 pyridoxamine 5'-phosphate oxidase [Rhodococcus sp. 06-156-3]OZD30495.1 pyridoxamine 5'-phosphate oxidase [Rhodococcus sp. 06-156-3b]